MIPDITPQVRCVALASLLAVLAGAGLTAAETTEASPPPRAGPSAPREVEATLSPELTDQPSSPSKISLGQNTKISLTAELSVRQDDNVFLNSTDEVSDTIIAVTPGIEFRFGQNSLIHGSLNYQNAFTRYVDKSAPDVSLSTADADFGYKSGNLEVISSASFRQMNQNNSELATVGQKSIFRRDVAGFNSSAEARLSAKTSVKTGLNYYKTDYKTGGFTGSQETEVPFKIYLEATPKVSVSAGLAHRWVNPQNGGVSGRDQDYNIGARGDFTAKLNGEFSLNYRTRKVGNNAAENLWGFNGGVNYEVTPKTVSSLVVASDFSTGALGESLKNSRYAIRISSAPTPQWQLAAGLSYRRVQYGPRVFGVNNTPVTLDRDDRFWEGNIQATYLCRSWLSVSADYTLRSNRSNLLAAQFSNNVLSLMVGWRY